MKDESKKFYNALKDLEATLPGIEEEENKAINNPELQQLVTLLQMARIFFPVNDPRISLFEKEIEEKKSYIAQKRNSYRSEHSRLSMELAALTKPVIGGFIEIFRGYLERLKIKSEIIDRKYEGFSKVTILTIKSNRNAVLAAHKMISEAEKKIQGMNLQPITVIQDEAERLQKEFKSIDLKEEGIEKMDENSYFKGSPPKGVSKDFDGPRSGL